MSETCAIKHPVTLDGFLTVEQLAEMLRVTRRTIFRWHLKRIGQPRVVTLCTRIVREQRSILKEKSEGAKFAVRLITQSQAGELSDRTPRRLQIDGTECQSAVSRRWRLVEAQS